MWSRELGVRLDGRRFLSRNTRTKFRGREITLLRPTTFMNRSGMAIKRCADFYNLDTGNILIIHDDIDLPVGRVKVVKNGGAGGHKGVLSIIHDLGSSQFPRIRIGIGRPRYSEDVEDYVLTPFYGDEKGIMKRVIGTAVRACELFVVEGIESAMNNINCKNLTKKEEMS